MKLHRIGNLAWAGKEIKHFGKEMGHHGGRDEASWGRKRGTAGQGIYKTRVLALHSSARPTLFIQYADEAHSLHHPLLSSCDYVPRAGFLFLHLTPPVGLPDVLGCYGVVIDFLGGILQVIHVEVARGVVHHGLESDVIGLIRIHGLTQQDAAYAYGGLAHHV